MKAKQITFIGAGNMARALIVGMLATGYESKYLSASNPPNDALDAFQKKMGIRLVHDNNEAVQAADVVVLSVKPNVLPSVCKELKALLVKKKPLVISVAAGVTIDLLSKWLDPSLSIIRAMPNTPSAVLAGASGLFANENATEAQKEFTEGLFRAVGVTVWVEDEDKMDLVTAVSGSGPAYYFLVIEAMQEAAIRKGLSEEDARILSLQTILGAARMAMESQHDVHELRRSVTSRKGTTEAALQVLEEGKLKELFDKAVDAAFQRGKSLSKSIEEDS